MTRYMILMGPDKVVKAFERGVIEIAPLAYMRGRTINHSFIILDEAQNTTPEQMKMFLTRIGFGSKAVITGDVTQIDLARGQKSGLVEVRSVLKDVRGIAFQDFLAEDVVRHPLVQKIVTAYEHYERKKGTNHECRAQTFFGGAICNQHRKFADASAVSPLDKGRVATRCANRVAHRG